LTGENRLNWELKEFADTKGEFETGIVVTTLKVPDSLVVDADSISQFLAG
jgi:hypothetical protein